MAVEHPGWRRALALHGPWLPQQLQRLAHETTDFPNQVIEMALAHKIKNQAEAAYRRGAVLEKRRELMRAWVDYLSGAATRVLADIFPPNVSPCSVQEKLD